LELQASEQYLLPDNGNVTRFEYTVQEPSGPIRHEFAGQAMATVTFMDEGLTLFARDNKKRELKDESPLGVSFNDVSQGSLGNCFFWSAVAAIARDPKRIVSMFGNPAEGLPKTVTFQFYDATATPVKPLNEKTVVETTLSLGHAQVSLSGDFDNDGKSAQ